MQLSHVQDLYTDDCKAISISRIDERLMGKCGGIYHPAKSFLHIDNDIPAPESYNSSYSEATIIIPTTAIVDSHECQQ